MSLVVSNEEKVEWGDLSMERTFDIVTKSSLYNIAREYQGFSNVLQGGWGRG